MGITVTEKHGFVLHKMLAGIKLMSPGQEVDPPMSTSKEVSLSFGGLCTVRCVYLLELNIYL